MEERIIIPGVFSAAGLIVPDPSIISPPMPFIEVETVWGAEYMTTKSLSFRQEAVARAVAPTVLVRESARSRFLVDGLRRSCNTCNLDGERLTDSGARDVACKPGAN